jgi:hypothetical protein
LSTRPRTTLYHSIRLRQFFTIASSRSDSTLVLIIGVAENPKDAENPRSTNDELNAVLPKDGIPRWKKESSHPDKLLWHLFDAFLRLQRFRRLPDERTSRFTSIAGVHGQSLWGLARVYHRHIVPGLRDRLPCDRLSVEYLWTQVLCLDQSSLLCCRYCGPDYCSGRRCIGRRSFVSGTTPSLTTSLRTPHA